MSSQDPVRVLITGAAGQIGYALCPLVANGSMLGPNQPVILHLLEIPRAEEALKGVAMELNDCAYPLLVDVVATVDAEVAFKDIDFGLFVGAFPRLKGMERKDLLAKNADIFIGQGKLLNKLAKKTVKVVVIGNPANTNCLMLMKNAPDIPRRNFTCLTRLDHNRAKHQIASKAGVLVKDIRGITIWGNHSSTQYPDASRVTCGEKTIGQLIDDSEWLKGDFVTTVQKRGAAIIAARGLSSALSASNAIVSHVRDWVLGTPEGDWVSMGVLADGSYGIEGDLIFSYPVTCSNGDYTIVKDIEINDFARTKLDETKKELEEERNAAFEIAGLKSE